MTDSTSSDLIVKAYHPALQTMSARGRFFSLSPPHHPFGLPLLGNMPEGPLFFLFMFSPLPDLLSHVPVYYPNGIILVLRIFSYDFKVIRAGYHFLLLLAPNLFGVMENVALPNYK